MQKVSEAVQTICERLTLPLGASAAPPEGESAFPSVQAVASPTLDPNLPPPSKYSGDPNTCRQFITQCQLTFNAQPSRFTTDAARVLYLVNLLEGPPLSFFNALFQQNSPVAQSFTAFSVELKRV